ncbi:DUF1653 domain-containing protein [Patescibacteria group bacterium]|nr:DUF1653 domain-containing protein [Patescibacteria group bacterium]
MEIKTGIYQHFKGNNYEVLGTAKHSETLEELVVYKSLYACPSEARKRMRGDGELWVRPLKMFLEKVEIGGKKVPRFKYIK